MAGFSSMAAGIYLDMGHLEYASPECRQLRDAVAYDLAGDQLLQSALESLGAAETVSFIKNNIDHHTGATFGCHENYLMRREAAVHAAGAWCAARLSRHPADLYRRRPGRTGESLAFDFEVPTSEETIDFQLSQRADHIVNDIYQWVQFNRAIINARDEPLADYRKVSPAPPPHWRLEHESVRESR